MVWGDPFLEVFDISINGAVCFVFLLQDRDKPTVEVLISGISRLDALDLNST